MKRNVTRDEYSKRGPYVLLSLSIALAGVVIAAVDWWSSRTLAQAQLDAARRATETSHYIEFKRRFTEIHKGAPKQRRDPRYVAKPGTVGWDYFEAFWGHSFDEWFATTQLLEPHESILWEKYYGPAVHDALKKKYYIDSLCYLMRDGEPSWRSHRDEFRKAVIALFPVSEKAPACLLAHE